MPKGTSYHLYRTTTGSARTRCRTPSAASEPAVDTSQPSRMNSTRIPQLWDFAPQEAACVSVHAAMPALDEGPVRHMDQINIGP
eukprot:scaffold421279_cov34-Prasinocladus_malaysianus.AAC.3